MTTELTNIVFYFAESLPLILTIQQTSAQQQFGLRVWEEEVRRLPSACQIGQGFQGVVYKASLVDQTGERLAVAIKMRAVGPMTWRAELCSTVMLRPV
jgi:hypothetical protein